MSGGFDLLILADLVFNHTEHAKLLSTVRLTLRQSLSARALVFFTPYRPWLYEKDMAFFDLAREGGFKVEPVLQHTMEEVMFPEDRGDELLRRTVFGYALQWEV
jgi:nicotinamide N-methyltransferase